MKRRNSFYDSIPLDSGEPEYANAMFRKVHEELKHHNKVSFGDADLVRIPQIEGRIFIKKNEKLGTSNVEYIYDQWYDPEKKQNRNRKAKIGVVFSVFPEAMIPEERYYEFFDERTGNLKERKAEERKEADPVPEGYDEAADGDNGTAEQVKEKKTAEPVLIDGAEKTGQEAQHTEARETTPENSLPQAITDDPDEIVRRVRAEAEEIRKQHQEKEKEKRKLAEQMMILGNTEQASRMALDSDAETSGIDFESMTESEQELARTEWVTGRFHILKDIVRRTHETIQAHARKQPDALINASKARRINKVLAEVRQRERKMGMLDLLALLQEPHEEEQDGKTVTVGTSYSDAEIILDYYCAVMNYTSYDKRLYED